MSNTSALLQLATSRVVIVAGKGGVGKTTVTAVLARAAAESGRRVLAIELDGRPELGRLLDGSVDVMHVNSGAALADYLSEQGFGRLAGRFIRSGAIDVVSTATPGLSDVITLGKVKQLERVGEYDLIVVDGPAAGHTITFLTSAAGLLDAVRAGPIHRQAAEVDQLLHDPKRCSTVLVSTPETTPVNELIETAYLVEERAGVSLAGVVLNRVEPDLDLDLDSIAELNSIAELDLDEPDRAAVLAAATFTHDRLEVQRSAIARLDAELPLHRVDMAALAVAHLEPSAIDTLIAGTPDEYTPPLAASPGTLVKHRTNPVPSLVESAEVIVCCGAGGVGKTTTAAALGIEARRLGRRAVVVTIDPARRLADALGLTDGLSGQPTLVPGGGPGELWAMMLDAAAMLEQVVRDHAGDEAQAQRIAENRFFVNMSASLSGTQEYMASEALYRLGHDDRFDLVIVDTPPSRNALEFLDSPGVLSRFLQHPVFKLMMFPTRTGLKVFGGASQLVLRRIGRIIGGDVLADAAAFFQAFTGMEVGFQERSEAVAAMMKAANTHFVIVTTPQFETMTEASWFGDQLTASGYGVAATVVNQVMPLFSTAMIEGRSSLPAASQLIENLTRLNRLAVDQRRVIGEVGETLTALGIVEVPLLATDVHDAEALSILGEHLMRVR